MSSLASLLVANANATPEKVVPCVGMVLASLCAVSDPDGTYEIDANNQLSLTLASTFYFSSGVSLKLLCDWVASNGRRVSRLATKAWRRGRTAHRKALLLGMIHARRIAQRSASIDGGRTTSHLGWRCSI